MPKYFTAIFLLLLFLCTSASAITVTASPQAINVAQGMSNPIQIFYQATQIDAPTFSAISSQGRFETPEGALLGTANSTVTITVVNTRGSATESVVVPAGILRQALEMNLNRMVFRRTFTPTIMDLLADTSEVQLRIVPPSAAQFSLTRMELAFNQPVPGDTTRPSSGGRITVPRNTRGLTATANLSYTGGGILRGQWKVDGQILDVVTRQLTVGAREVRITSPVTPGFPTYATGLHRVEFEVLNPDPGFISPVIFYYVSDEPPGPPLGSLRLTAPFDRQHIHLLADALPEFTWEPARNSVVYHFQIYGLETPAGLQDLSRVDFSGKKPLVAALTKEPSYRISIFDFDRILPGIPYIWQVKAYDAGTGVAASLSRVVYFTAPDQTVSPSGQTKEGIPQTGDTEKP